MAVTRKSAGHTAIEELLRNSSSYRIVNELPLSELGETTRRGWYDIAILDIKTVIEIQGLQHVKPVAFDGDHEAAVEKFETQKLNDRFKERWAWDNGWCFVEMTDVEAKKMTAVELWNRIREAQIQATLTNLSSTAPTILTKPDTSKLKELAREFRREQYKRYKEWKKNRESNRSN